MVRYSPRNRHWASVCLDGEKNDRMAFQVRADYQNHAIGWLQKGYSSSGGGTVVKFRNYPGLIGPSVCM